MIDEQPSRTPIVLSAAGAILVMLVCILWQIESSRAVVRDAAVQVALKRALQTAPLREDVARAAELRRYNTYAAYVYFAAFATIAVAACLLVFGRPRRRTLYARHNRGHEEPRFDAPLSEPAGGDDSTGPA